MNPTRREFLQQVGAGTLGASALAGGSSAAAAPNAESAATNPCVIAVYLRGGADALSAVAPYSDPDYRRYAEFESIIVYERRLEAPPVQFD